MKAINLNNIFNISIKPIKGTFTLTLEKHYPVYMKITVLIEKKDNKRIILFTDEKDRSRIKSLAYLVAQMYKNQFNQFPKEIKILNGNKIKIKINPFENFSQSYNKLIFILNKKGEEKCKKLKH